ncbi:uncharacterized protein Dwil_GK19528 [Drosophila willistoni]|uniref:Uncharacterized protein n=1 Tax=Drosophila willistoni TaxID=7260 RepID=B4MNQ8_DROWI|nr:uncharacterized protein LOC6639748 [Drosophila willistoni]EDW73747.1 uncharacterized protein Dwil_GK19528 [Drosophila willistoni]
MKAAAGRAITSGSASARMTAPPLSSHSTGGRKRQSMASAHGGAGDGGADVGGGVWKATGGRRLGGSESHGTTTTPRLEQPTIASALRAASNREAIKQQRERAAAAVSANLNKPVKVATRARTGGGGGLVGVAAGATAAAAKRQRDLTSKQATRARLWAPKKASGNAPSTGGGISHMRKDNNKLKEVKSLGTLNVINDHPAIISKEEHLLEMAIQTNEAEILDHNLLSGNIRILTPSPHVVTEIDKCRREAKTKADRQTIRRFTPHEQEEEEHLDKLKEFMDRNAVTKRTPKKPPPVTYGTYDHQFSNVFKSMDDFFRSEVPKSESITNIKERIKRKEVELMSLFDNMDNMADKSDVEY